MKIAIINPRASYYMGGAEVVPLMQARYLAQLGHEIVFITSAQKNLSDHFKSFIETAPANVIVEYVDTPPYRGMEQEPGLDWSRWNIEAAAFGVAAQKIYADHSDADIFATHLSADSLFIPAGINNVLHLHGSPKANDPLIKASMARPNSCVAVSKSVYDWWRKHYQAVPMRVLTNGIDIDFFNGDVHSERDIDLLYAGRFLPHKGIDDLLLAAPKQASIVVAGHGPQESELRRIAADRNLKIKFAISPSNEELRHLYANTKLFVCVSRGKEGVLTTMLEAGASGAAIITASGSGMTDLAVNQKNAVVVKPGNTDELTDAIANLLADKLKRTRLALTMQNEIRSDWSWLKKASKLEEIYAGTN